MPKHPDASKSGRPLRIAAELRHKTLSARSRFHRTRIPGIRFRFVLVATWWPVDERANVCGL